MSYKHFTIEERELIQQRLWAKASLRSIGQALARSASSISREIQRNQPPVHKVYTPRLAHEKALQKRQRRGRTQRLKNEKIRHYVITHLKLRWSPEQISGRLKRDLGERISHEAIYQYIYHQIHRQGWGLLKPGGEDLRIYLRRRRKRRLAKGARRCQRIFRPLGPSIDERPLVVEQRARVGDWEGDTLESLNHLPGLNTLVERKTGFAYLTKLTDRTGTATAQAMTKRLKSLPVSLKHTVTLDNGPENRDWLTIAGETGLQCFYAHAYHAWERGSNENLNGLVRDYFPKKTDFTRIPGAEIALVEHALNTRPRKRLNYLTPLEALSVAVEG